MWLSLAFLSAALLGFYDVFKKRSLRDNAVVPVLFVNTLLCSLIFLPLIVGSAAGWIAPDAAVYVPTGDWAAHRLILVKSLIVLSSWLLGYVGMKHLPLTIVGPIKYDQEMNGLTYSDTVISGGQWQSDGEGGYKLVIIDNTVYDQISTTGSYVEGNATQK